MRSSLSNGKNCDFTHRPFGEGVNRWKPGLSRHLATAERGGPVGNHAVTLKVTPFLRIECKFWLTTDDDWNAAANNPPSLFRRVALNTQSLKWKSR